MAGENWRLESSAKTKAKSTYCKYTNNISFALFIKLLNNIPTEIGQDAVYISIITFQEQGEEYYDSGNDVKRGECL